MKRQTELYYEGGTELGASQTGNAMTFDDDGLLTRSVQTITYEPDSLGSFS